MGRNDKVLIINGSPRKSKNCHSVVKELVKKFEENEINYKVLDIYKMDIDYCTACGACEKTGYCRIKDDMTPIYEEFNKSTGTITVSPMYFSSVSTKVKTVVDRTQAFFSSKYVLGKSSIDRDKFRLGMYIAIGGQPEFENQFLGGQIVMDIFYKSINTDLEYNLYLSNSDEVPFEENEDFKAKFNRDVDEYIKKITTGDKKITYQIRILEHLFKNPFFSPVEEPYDVISDVSQFHFTDNFYLPVYLVRQTYSGYKNEKNIYTEKEAKQIASRNLKKYIDDLEEKGIQITEKNVIIERTKKKYVVKGTIETLKSIVSYQPTKIIEQSSEERQPTDESD